MEVAGGRHAGRCPRGFASRKLADPHRFFSRIAEIDSTSQDSFDVLQLEDGRIFERSSKVLSVEGRSVGRLWSFRDVTQSYRSEIASRQLAAIVASSDDGVVGKDFEHCYRELESRSGAYFRIHRRGNDRHVNHAIDSA